MKKLLFIFLLMIPFMIFSQNEIKFTYYESGQIKSYGKFDNNGVRDGQWFFYYENGIVHQNVNYKKGSPWTSTWYFYHENGQISERGNFNDGKLISVTCWDKTGNEISCD